MWSIIGILFTGVIVTIIDVKPLMKGKFYREILIYIFLLLIGLTLAILLGLRRRIPTPLDLLNYLYRPFISILERFLS